MKKYLRSVFVLVAALALLVAGCSTIDSRIKEKSDAFAKLPKGQQEKIRNGIITRAFTQDMVYMALDKPERIIPGAGPGEETWVYSNFYSSDGRSVAMSSKIVAGGFSGGTVSANRNARPSYQLTYDSANEDIKAESTIKVHVIFHLGRVTDIQIINNGKAK